MSIFQPVTQVRLTNVAVVRLNKGGRRFEVACYKNKIVDYRNGKEKNLDEVLQSESIFSNVSKGVLANKKQLNESFGTSDEMPIIAEILKRGQVQISEKEREAYYENVWREVSTLVSEKCVNPGNNRRYTPDMIRQAMKMAEFSPHPTKKPKQQFLDCVKLLIERNVIPIQRAKMCLKITMNTGECLNEDILLHLKEIGAEIFDKSTNVYSSNVEFLLEPSLYRNLENFSHSNHASLEVVQLTVMEEGDAGLELDLLGRNKERAQEREQTELRSRVIFDEDELSNQITSRLKVKSDSEDDKYVTPQNSRKAAKKAQKKSKKAKRREKEAEAERLARKEKEIQRQAEREARLKENDKSYEAIQSTYAESSGDVSSFTSCNTCGGKFTKSQYRAHFRTDWHRYNLKLKMQGVPCITEEEFKLADIDFF
mmetsp:Transcript_3796/g.5170  ORF Transcript_3796/g.5170 Transcript_3796/m.5170 type:complete len:426 (-) Transcript_3796:149-1426(-)